MTNKIRTLKLDSKQPTNVDFMYRELNIIETVETLQPQSSVDDIVKVLTHVSEEYRSMSCEPAIKAVFDGDKQAADQVVRWVSKTIILDQIVRQLSGRGVTGDRSIENAIDPSMN